jgi:hypothetical protein
MTTPIPRLKYGDVASLHWEDTQATLGIRACARVDVGADGLCLFDHGGRLIADGGAVREITMYGRSVDWVDSMCTAWLAVKFAHVHARPEWSSQTVAGELLRIT